LQVEEVVLVEDVVWELDKRVTGKIQNLETRECLYGKLTPKYYHNPYRSQLFLDTMVDTLFYQL